MVAYEVVGDGLVLSPLTLTSFEVLFPPVYFCVRENDGKILDRWAHKAFIVSNDGKVEALDADDRSLPEPVRIHLHPGSVLIPGLVDGHAHAPQTRNRGIGMDLPLLKWLERYTFPEEARYSSRDYAKAQYESAVRSHLRAGTTTISYFASIHLEATRQLADVCAYYGQRAMVGKVSMDRNCPDFYREETLSALVDAAVFVREMDGLYSPLGDKIEKAKKGKGNYGEDDDLLPDDLLPPLVQAVVTPRFVPTCSDTLLSTLGDIASGKGGTKSGAPVRVQSHLSETPDEIEWVKSLCPEATCYADAYDRHGLLGPKDEAVEVKGGGKSSGGSSGGGTKRKRSAASDFPPMRAYMAHCVHCSGQDRSLLLKRGCAIVHCPNSNLTIGSGLCDVRALLSEGQTVCLGTDVSGGFSPSMFDAIRCAAHVSKTLKIVDSGRLVAPGGRVVPSGGTAAAIKVEHEDEGKGKGKGKGEKKGESKQTKPYEPLGVTELFYLATLGGAKALSLENQVGRLGIGFAFDAIVVRAQAGFNRDGCIKEALAQPELALEWLSRCLFLTETADVRLVVVAGRKRVDPGKICINTSMARVDCFNNGEYCNLEIHKPKRTILPHRGTYDRK